MVARPYSAFLSVSTAHHNANCGYPFMVGRRYLVYAATNSRGLSTSYCTPTKPLAEAKADLAILGPGQQPINYLSEISAPYLLTVIGATLALGVFYWRHKRTRLSVSL